MMPDLGKYTLPVIGAYVVAIALLVLLVAVTLWRGARVRRQLDEIENRRRGKHGKT